MKALLSVEKPEADNSALADKRHAEPKPSSIKSGMQAVPSGDDRLAAQKSDSQVQAMPVLRRKVSGTFGYAPDYSWLQGQVQKRPNGQWVLRFSDAGDNAPLGARVLLEDDRRLDELLDGDVIQVDGRLRTLASNASQDPPAIYKIYRLTKISSLGRSLAP